MQNTSAFDAQLSTLHAQKYPRSTVQPPETSLEDRTVNGEIGGSSPDVYRAVHSLVVQNHISLDIFYTEPDSARPDPQSPAGLVAQRDARKKQQQDRLATLRAAQQKS